jgi:hypothetical protein
MTCSAFARGCSFCPVVNSTAFSRSFGEARRTALMAHRLEKKRNSWDSLNDCSDALQSTIN